MIGGAPGLLLSRKSLAVGSALKGICDASPELQSTTAADIPAPPVLEITPGPFKGTRDSLREWQVPEWYRDAKLVSCSWLKLYS